MEPDAILMDVQMLNQNLGYQARGDKMLGSKIYSDE
jgi:hypothetical protein